MRSFTANEKKILAQQKNIQGAFLDILKHGKRLSQRRLSQALTLIAVTKLPSLRPILINGEPFLDKDPAEVMRSQALLREAMQHFLKDSPGLTMEEAIKKMSDLIFICLHTMVKLSCRLYDGEDAENSTVKRVAQSFMKEVYRMNQDKESDEDESEEWKS